MDNILPDNEYQEIEGRQYLNPQTGLDESNAFIENLRATQGQQNQQIASDTYNLGTDIQSVQGGLGTNTPANMGYFTSRYQTPQTNSAVANLRAAAQAQALNEVLSNEQAIWKKRYQDAYRNYQKRQNARSSGGGGNLGGNPGTTDGGVDYDYTDNGEREVGSVEPSYSPMGSGDYPYTSNASQLNGGGVLPTNTGVISGPTNNLLPNGNVNIQRDKFGRITSLTYNGKTFTGDAAKQRYNFLQNSGTIGGKN
jgi:hypothetical protein